MVIGVVRYVCGTISHKSINIFVQPKIRPPLPEGYGEKKDKKNKNQEQDKENNDKKRENDDSAEQSKEGTTKKAKVEEEEVKESATNQASTVA